MILNHALQRKYVFLAAILSSILLLAFGFGVDYVTGKAFSLGTVQKWSLIIGAGLAVLAVLLAFFGKRDVLSNLAIDHAYRPEIDGLRAVAVLAVLLFHAKLRTFAGGYVGVDVFFVISGYLITRLLLIDLQKGQFSLVRFYERRIRRIFPALFAVVFAVLLFGWFLYHAKTYLPVSRSAFAALSSWANLQFWSEAGYWDSPSAAKPLLHTWSLSVEEQFYLVYPLFLWLTARYLKNWIREALWIVWIASLAWSAWVVGFGNPMDAFYLPQFRVWELVTGGLLLLYPWQPKALFGQIGGMLGIALIGYAVFTFNSSTLFPGWMAVFPVLGAGLVVWAGQRSVFGRILSTPPFVFIGKISYSLYLWHWPILVLTQYLVITRLGSLNRLGLLAISIVIAALSWKFVEEPFRKNTFISRRGVFTAAAVGLFLVGGLFWASSATRGLPFRYASKNIADVRQYNADHMDFKSCFPSHRKDIGCQLGDLNVLAAFVITGDSHAYSIAPGFAQAAITINQSGWLVSKSSCMPILGVEKYIASSAEIDECFSVTQDAINYVLTTPGIDVLVLDAKWERDFFSSPFNLDVDLHQLTEDHPEWSGESKSEALFKLSMANILDAMSAAGKRVIIVLPVPEPGTDVPAAYTIGKLTGRDVSSIININKKEHYAENAKIIKFFKEMAEAYPNVALFDPAQILCGKDVCESVVNDMPAYIDDNHLSTNGAKELSDALAKLLTSP